MMDNNLDLTTLVREARDAGASGYVELDRIGDRARAFVVPNGYQLQIEDVTRWEDFPRRIQGDFAFVGVDSLVRYIDRHRDGDSLAYVQDVYGQGPKMLLSDRTVLRVVLNDHPERVDDGFDPPEPAAQHRDHVARLVLRPTAAARRWGSVLDSTIDQETLLDLVVDGIAEIADPDAAVLRDLAQDLHAIRTTEVKSVMRTGGEGSIELAENVQLRAGVGRQVTFPEVITIVFQPYASTSRMIRVEVRVKAKVVGNKVGFTLSASGLDDQIASLIQDIAAEFAERTGMTPLWTP